GKANRHVAGSDSAHEGMFQEPGGACRSRRAGGSRLRGGNYLAADRKALVCIQRLRLMQSVFAAIDMRPDQHGSDTSADSLPLRTRKTLAPVPIRTRVVLAAHAP